MTISTLLQLQVKEKVQQCLNILLGEETAKYINITVEFKNGIKTAAGLAYQSEQRIVLNENLFLANKQSFFDEIIGHEVCHVVQHILYPNESLHHGKRWKELMMMLGLRLSVYHNLDVSAVDDKVFRYVCNCDGGFRYHQIVEKVHKEIEKGSRIRNCGTCSTRIIYYPRGDC